MFMNATVLQVNRQSLLVRNDATGEEVLVLFHSPSRFSPGERIRITFNGQMTFSIPPQITATAIHSFGTPTPGPGATPSQMRAAVLQRGNNFLVVQNLQTRQQFRVEYRFASHFCVGQQVSIRYDTLTLGNPPRITATDITPIC